MAKLLTMQRSLRGFPNTEKFHTVIGGIICLIARRSSDHPGPHSKLKSEKKCNIRKLHANNKIKVLKKKFRLKKFPKTLILAFDISIKFHFFADFRALWICAFSNLKGYFKSNLGPKWNCFLRNSSTTIEICI